MKKLKVYFSLFLEFFKIGLFTFGGGYAMIAILERELVEKKKLIDKDEFLDIIAISESTPGPIAINSATFIGYKVAKFFGSFFSTLGVVLPSFIIILAISFFINKFNLLEIEYVKYAFHGINICVGFLIVSAGVKLLKKQKKNLFNILLFAFSFVSLVLISIFNLNISSIYLILFGGFVGIINYIIYLIKSNDKRGDK